MLGGINAVIVGNYLTTLGRPAEADLELLDELKMPIKALNATLCDMGANSTSTPASPRVGESRRRATRPGATALLRRLRPPDDRAGPPRRLVGEVLAARDVGLEGP